MDVAYWQPAAEEAARNSQSLQSSSSKTGLARSLYRNRDKKMAFRFYDLAAIFFCARGRSYECGCLSACGRDVVCMLQYSVGGVTQ